MIMKIMPIDGSAKMKVMADGKFDVMNDLSQVK